DLIGPLARLAEEEGFFVIMVTGDKDFMQLVSDRSIIWDPMKDIIIDKGYVKEKTGVEVGQVIDVMGLTGDKSDNVPGVPGIGPKTASDLINNYGNLESLYEQLDKITKKKQHENLTKHKDQAFLSKRLVTIDTNTPVAFDSELFRLKNPDNNLLSDLFKELEFRKFQQAFKKETDLSKKKYSPVLDLGTFSELVNRLENSEIFALDTETTGKNPMHADLVGLSFSFIQDEAFYIPVGHDYPDAPEQLDMETVLSALRPILENPDIKKVGQNIKYDWIVLNRSGINLKGVAFDTMIASYLINPSRRGHSLDQIALDNFSHQMISYEEAIKSDTAKGKKLSSFAKVPIEKAVPYACEDADLTFMAFKLLSGLLKEKGFYELFENIEMPLISVLTNMELNGIKVDREKLYDLSKSFEHELERIENEVYSLAGEEFNIKSSQQLGSILFEKLKLPVQKKTKKKTGYSTDVDVLKILSTMHELPALILRQRTLAKLKSTYTDALSDLVHQETGRIHTSFNQTITATGRLSSSKPNLQNIPIRTDEGREIRKAFIPRSGWTLIAADYSHIELRILAHYSDDEILKDAFIKDEDIHTRTAAEVFQEFPSFITPDMRRQAKVINFGIIYGMSPFGLSKELDISQKMAKNYIDGYFKRYNKVKLFIDHAIEEARKTGTASTLLGRKRPIPDIKSSNRNVRMFAERTAVNTPIQGTAADLIKIAMINVDLAFRKEGLKSAMLLSVHDEIVFESPPEEVDIVMDLVEKTMEGVWDLKVPLKVNLASGQNWADAH
ncbi:MAG: DNA polymerase I, partial [Desulfobacteraceae bacterium]|nr:DNA polymerase I [Desulfobacteraceae bacterium]